MDISLDIEYTTTIYMNSLNIECIVVMTSIFESGYQRGAHAVKCILFVESLYALVSLNWGQKEPNDA